MVGDLEIRIPCLSLPDPDYRHVLAEAIMCRAVVIVTLNTKDFPGSTLSDYGIEAQHPDEFLTHLFHLSSESVVSAVPQQRERLRDPPQTAEQQLGTPERQGVTEKLGLLSRFLAQI